MLQYDDDDNQFDRRFPEPSDGLLTTLSLLLTIMSAQHKPRGLYERCFKRFFDIVLSLSAIILLSWLLIIVAILVRIFLGSPVIFKQERPGKDAKTFKVYKFRTMLDPQTRDGRKITDNERQDAILKGHVLDVLSDEERLTKFGRFLRSTSLDELPEFFNILGGTMSVVGPRPLLKINVGYYTPEEDRRHEVLPGLTGLAQIHGRTAVSFETRFRYDVQYVDNVTFWNDLSIVVKTFLVVFACKDVAQGVDDVEPFTVTRQRQLAQIAGVTADEVTKLPLEERNKLLVRLQELQRAESASDSDGRKAEVNA